MFSINKELFVELSDMFSQEKDVVPWHTPTLPPDNKQLIIQYTFILIKGMCSAVATEVVARLNILVFNCLTSIA